MREYELIIDEAFKNGLSPHRTTQINSQFMSELLGFRMSRSGIELYENKINPLPVTVDLLYYWPFPQFIVGEKYNLLIVRDSLVNMEDIVYTISDDHQTITHVFSIDELTFGQGGLMEVADFGSYAFMTNGVIMIYYDIAAGMWSHKISDPLIPMMNTVCNFRGQAVGGNITSNWYDCDEKYYVWSKIGNMDFTVDNSNTAGYRRCPYGGDVLNVRALSDLVVGYSSEGIIGMFPVVEPTPTFAFKSLSNIGLLNKGAVNGSLDKHIYVGEDFILRQITKEGITELGYQNQMESLSDEDIIITYDRKFNDFYIGNSIKTFLLSPSGMSEIHQHPSAVWRKNNETYMLPDTIDEGNNLITTEPFDMGYGGQKTIFTMETDAQVDKQVYVSPSYTNNNIDYYTPQFTMLNHQNVASTVVSGNSFKFNLIFNNEATTAKINRIKARYKMTDMRGIRGVYAPPPRGQ